MAIHLCKRLLALVVLINLADVTYSFSVLPVLPPLRTSLEQRTVLFGKKANRKSKGGGGGGGGKRQPPQEKQSVKEARFDAQTRQFMFSIVGLTKVLPDKSKTILKNINLAL